MLSIKLGASKNLITYLLKRDPQKNDTICLGVNSNYIRMIHNFRKQWSIVIMGHLKSFRIWKDIDFKAQGESLTSDS